jgi:hypothetical protein
MGGYTTFLWPACTIMIGSGRTFWEKIQMILKGLSHNITAQKEEGKVEGGRGQPENGFASSVCVHSARRSEPSDQLKKRLDDSLCPCEVFSHHQQISQSHFRPFRNFAVKKTVSIQIEGPSSRMCDSISIIKLLKFLKGLPHFLTRSSHWLVQLSRQSLTALSSESFFSL